MVCRYAGNLTTWCVVCIITTTTWCVVMQGILLHGASYVLSLCIRISTAPAVNSTTWCVVSFDDAHHTYGVTHLTESLP